MSRTIKIVNPYGNYIILRGKPCDDCCPAYGAEIDDSQYEELKRFINMNTKVYD